MSVWWDELKRNHFLAKSPEIRQSLDTTSVTYSPMTIFSTLHQMLQNTGLEDDYDTQVWIITTLATYKDGKLVEFVKPTQDFATKNKLLYSMRNTLWQLLT